jgi:phosphoribosyl-ATP pyrophosphohydrolase
LLYHALVALRAAGGSLSDVQRVLAQRSAPGPTSVLRPPPPKGRSAS